MPTAPLDGDLHLPGSDGVWSVGRPDLRQADRPGPALPALDVLEALSELSGDAAQADGGIAEALFAWIMPRPRNADTLTQARMVPLLGAAADLIANGTQTSPDIARLGALALEQELRMQRALADRRAALTLKS